MALIGTQSTKLETSDNVHVALLPNTLRRAPAPAPSTGGGISVYTR
jgi:hypothetical protein